LFESRVVASCRDKKGAYRDLRRIFDIFAGEATQAQSCVRRLEKKGAGVRFFLADEWPNLATADGV
jgi:hypothetical protein